MERKHLFIVIGIIAIFAIGLVGFYLVSNGQPDGLEKTMEEGGAQESPVYNAPLSYGDGYLSTLAMGVVGFFITLFAVLALLRWRKSSKGSPEGGEASREGGRSP